LKAITTAIFMAWEIDFAEPVRDRSSVERIGVIS
jgi:hypothetical protein